MAIKIGGTTVIDNSANITSSVGGFKTVGGVAITGSGNIDAAPSTAYGQVGGYIFAWSTAGVTMNPGATRSGSGLYPGNCFFYGGDEYGHYSTTASGTYRLMGLVGRHLNYYGYQNYSNRNKTGSIWCRIS
mgnify:CR=1 FL=1